MIGYVRRLDIDGTVRIRELDNAYSPTLFDGYFLNSLLLTLKEAFYKNLPIEFQTFDDKIVSAEIAKYNHLYWFELSSFTYKFNGRWNNCLT